LVWVSLGFFAFAFALIGHLPFLVTLVRMWWRDGENTRLIFYRTCLKTWLLAVMIDLWSAYNLNPLSHELCQAINAYEFTNDTIILVANAKNNMTICQLQYRIQRIVYYMFVSDF
jgi:hypothetical protein